MKKALRYIGVFALTAALAGCAQAAVAPDFTDGQAVVAEFENNGFTVSDVDNTAEGTVQFKVVDGDGGANVYVQSFDSLEDALSVYDSTKAALTQSEYYMMSEKENGRGSLAVFNNSINYVNAVAAFDAANQTLIVVSEISQNNMPYVYDVLASYGFNFQ